MSTALALIARVNRLQRMQAARMPKAPGVKRAAIESAKADFSRYGDDFLAFAALLDILPRVGVRQKLRPNPIQAAYEAARTLRDILLKPRQVGITTWELARDVWFFLTRPGARVVVVVQSVTDHGPLRETSEKIRIMLESLADQGLRLPLRTETISEWVLAGRDASLRIVEAGASEAAAAKKGRSGTITRLHVTELAFFEFASDTLNAILECVPGPEYGTEIVIESTANGAAGTFYERYQAAKERRSGYRAHFFPWMDQREYQAPLEPGEQITPITDRERELVERHHASPEQVKWYRQKVEDKGPDLVDQEYPVDENRAWRVAGRLFFDKARTESLHAKASPPLAIEDHGDLHVWKRPEKGRSYVVVVDPSEGTGGDPGAAVVRERRTGEHVATLHGQFPPWMLAAKVAKLGHDYNDALVVVERNNHGHAVLQGLERGAVEGDAPPSGNAYRNTYVGRDGKPGWCSTSITRSAALDALESAHRGGTWETRDERVLGEMLTFVVNKDGKAAAAGGAHDDLVMAEAIAQDVIANVGATVKAQSSHVEASFEDQGIGI